MSREFRLGIFVIAMLLILAGGLFLIGRNRSLFSSTYRVQAQFQNVAGLDEGAEVRVGGLHEGTVKHIHLPRQPDGKVTVVMDVKNGTRDIIKKDSLASILAEGLLGDKYVEISFGSKDAPAIREGETIGSEPPRDFVDLIKKTDQILDTTQSTMKNVDVATNHLQAISSKIDQGKGTIGELINDKTVYRQVAQGATSFQENMEALKHNFLLRGFFKNRGYEDSSELTNHEVSHLPAGPEVQRFTFDAGQIFDKRDTAKLKNQKLLNEAGNFLQDHTFALAVVTASTGMQGDSNQDRVLAQARSMVVRDYFVQNFGLDDTRLKTMGIGKPKIAGDSNKVEIIIYSRTNIAQGKHQTDSPR
jgi:phospholipid/cholesterol/gamma-HCH transport system substrate-binding protein